VSGTTRAKLNKAKAASIPIALPKLEEQKRIAAILDKADSVRRQRHSVVEISRDAIYDFFLDQFDDPNTNPNNYESLPISEVAKIVTGNTPSRKEPENYGNGIEWIKSDNINTPSHYLTPANERLSKAGEKKSRPVPAGSTLVTCIAGSPDCIGNAALADRRVASNQQINAAIPGDRLNDKFLYAMILVLKPAIQALSSKSMKGMVSKGKFETLKVIVPPESEQEQFAKLFDQTVSLVKKFDHASGEAEDLFNSLFQRAFKGELWK
jgi:type I restriction enzyme S subunit